MQHIWLARLKNRVRRVEARFNPFARRVIFDQCSLKCARSIWWDEASQEVFDHEIGPYFTALETQGGNHTGIIDAGASTGLFTMAAACRYPKAQIYAFEPSIRQQILLNRNLKNNNLADRVVVVPHGLWNQSCRLAFRTHGAISSLEAAAQIPEGYAFPETVPVLSLDDWMRSRQVHNVTLIKMDIEGAEIEALEGSKGFLTSVHPTLLVQAYHMRNGTRTFERCASYLTGIGYDCKEIGNTGLLHATSNAAGSH
jgi:FkbM family methyltransferase